MKRLIILLVVASLFCSCKKVLGVGARIDDNGNQVNITAPQGTGVDPNGGH